MRFESQNIEFGNLIVYFNYNVFILRPIAFGSIVMLNIKEPAQFGTIPTLCLEAERG